MNSLYLNKSIKYFLVINIFLCSFFSFSQEKPKQEQRIPIEGELQTWYYDADGDGYGDCTNTWESVIMPVNYSFQCGDCDLNNPNITMALVYLDQDNDGFGDPNNADYMTCESVGANSGYSLNNLDCDDNNQDIHPNTVWYYDSNSNGIIDEFDTVTTIVSCQSPGQNYLNNSIENYNYTLTTNYDLKNIATGTNKIYFDELGKSNLILSKDFATNIIWSNETIYDSFGRTFKSSFESPNIFGNFNKFGILSSSVDYPSSNSYVDYYSDNNILEPYQDKATHPFSQINYDKLNPENVVDVIGGNQIGGQWRTGFTYTVPAAQEMYYVFGYDFFNGPLSGSPIKEEIQTKFYKTVSIDANGVENVVFTDGEGKTLASARSGATSPATINPYQVHSLIGTQGYVDVCIPPGILSSQINLIQPAGANDYDVYNLRDNTGLITTAPLTGGNCYRIVAKVTPTAEPKIFVTNATPGVLTSTTTDPAGVKGVTYSVNYYDYAINVYDKTGRLSKSIQPNGFRDVYAGSPATFTITPAPAYLASANYATSYLYNTLGQVIQVTSADEGISKFAYRQDGQIRYSQNALQAASKKASYINYDSNGRPIESGVITSTNPTITIPVFWSTLQGNVDQPVVVPTTLGATSLSERTFSVYDDITNVSTTPTTQIPSPYSIIIPSTHSLATLASGYNQKNLAGNVAATYKADSGTTINSITYYSYDIYGRSEWIVQHIENIGSNALNPTAKTIDYEYDYNGNVSRVVYQKNLIAERFIHKYTYDLNGTLTKVESGSGNNPLTVDADYSYYKSGELKRVNIAQGAQGLDYVYTLGGKLKSINHPSLERAKDPGQDGVKGGANAYVMQDIFGITLDYYNGDYTRSLTNITTSTSITPPDYSGNIKASRWANKMITDDWPSPTTTTANQKAYLYDYNRDRWLTDSNFGTTNNTGLITLAGTIHSEQGIEYDSNGNITDLKRTNNLGALIDELRYEYSNLTPKNNQLRQVTDFTTASYPNDINNGQPINNYVYNAIGQLTSNANELTYYVYNTQGLVTEVRVGNTTYATSPTIVKFYYNERGHRIRKENFVSNSIFSTDYYVSDLSGNVMAIYNRLATAPTIVAQKEMPIYGLNRLGVCMKPAGSNPDIKNYQITDHLGNVRAVIQKIGTNPITMLSYADYYPFGEQLTSRSSSAGYRYAFQGQEYDSETQMEAFELRLWDGRLGRWLSPDPAGQFASPYLGMGNNPIGMIDLDGGISFGYDQFGFYKGFGKGLWNGTKGLAKSIWYLGDTLEGLGQLTLTSVATSGVFGGVPNAHLSNAINFDAQFGTHTADNYVGMANAIGKFGNALVSSNAETAGEAWGELVFAAIGLKGLGTASKASKAAVIAEAGVGGEIIALEAAESQAVLTQTVAKTGWKVGQPITNLTAKGNVPVWSTVRQRFWKNEAFHNGSTYSESNLLRMQKGLAPQRLNPNTLLMESMELHHHIVPQRNGGLFDFIKVWPDEHRALDPFRR